MQHKSVSNESESTTARMWSSAFRRRRFSFCLDYRDGLQTKYIRCIELLPTDIGPFRRLQSSSVTLTCPVRDADMENVSEECFRFEWKRRHFGKWQSRRLRRANTLSDFPHLWALQQICFHFFPSLHTVKIEWLLRPQKQNRNSKQFYFRYRFVFEAFFSTTNFAAKQFYI